MDKVNKLVRNKVAESIEADGVETKTRTLSEEEYIEALDKKLLEEVNEYQTDIHLEKMVDILEVVYAISEARGYPIEVLEAKRLNKKNELGGFDQKLFLEAVDKKAEETDNISDMTAARKWHEIPKEMKAALVSNVFCSECGVTTIVDYTVVDKPFGIVLKGKCTTCHANVARVVEN